MDTKKKADNKATDKPAERRPEDMAGPRQGAYDPTKPDTTRRQPEAPEDRKEFGKPEGDPYGKEAPKPGIRQGDRDEGERSDRSSGRPVQLDKGSESAKR